MCRAVPPAPLIFVVALWLWGICGTSVRAQHQVPQGKTDPFLDWLENKWDDDPSVTLALTDSLLHLPTPLDSARLMRCLKLRARALRALGDYVPAIDTWGEVHRYATLHHDSLLLAEAADQIGIMNTFMGNYLKGQPYLLEVARIYDDIGTPADRARATNGLAILYDDLDRKDEAASMYRRALQLYESVDDTMGRANVHANLGLLYLYTGAYDSSEYHLGQQGQLDSLMGSDYGLAFYYDFLSELRREQERYTEALALAERGLALRHELPSHYNRAESHNSVAGILLELGRYAEAIGHARQVLSFRDRHESLSQESIALKNLSLAYEGMGRADTALRYHKRFKEISDSIYRRDHLAEITAKNALYEKARQDEKIAELDRLNALNEAKLGRRNTALWLTGAGLSLVSFFTLTVWVLFRKIRSQKAVLESLNAHKDLLLREVHHRVKNNLQMVSSLLALQSDYVEDGVALQAIEMGRQRVRSMAILHQRMYLGDEVSPTVSARDYLNQLIDELLGGLGGSGVVVTVHKRMEDVLLDIDRLIPLGLIANELITNAIKYAFVGRSSGTLEIVLRRQDDWVTLSVADDGPGLDGRDMTGEESFGSLLIHTLAEQLEGELEIKGREGTKISLRFWVT